MKDSEIMAALIASFDARGDGWGAVARTAEALGIGRPAVCKFRDSDRIPAGRRFQVRKLLHQRTPHRLPLTWLNVHQGEGA